MTVKLRDIPILLHIVKSHQKDNKSKRDEVKKTFENTEQTREATLPDYLRLEQFCLEAEILLFEEQNLVLTKIGEEILQKSDDNYYINQRLKELFVKKCFLKGNFSKKVLPALAEFENNSKYKMDKVTRLFEQQDILPILYEANLLIKQAPDVIINQEFSQEVEKEVINLPRKKPKITQIQLEKDLEREKENKKMIGEIAENIVLEFEKKRLGKNGHAKIRRISQEYANAGYDIESDGRLIEVKGSTGDEFDIYWSQNEIETARANGDKYWLYFVPGVDVKRKKSKKEPILIHDPITNILESDQYKEKEETLHLIKNNPEEN